MRIFKHAVVCKASSPIESMKKIAAAVATLPAMIAAHPAYALVSSSRCQVRHDVAIYSVGSDFSWSRPRSGR